MPFNKSAFEFLVNDFVYTTEKCLFKLLPGQMPSVEITHNTEKQHTKIFLRQGHSDHNLSVFATRVVQFLPPPAPEGTQDDPTTIMSRHTIGIGK